MGKILKEKPQKLVWLINLTNSLPPSKITNAGKLSTFRRALKLALKDYIAGQEQIMEIFRADAKEYAGKKQTLDEKKNKKEIEGLDKAIEDLQKEADVKLKEYADEHKEEVTVTFDNEAFLYVQTLFGEAASTLFSQVMKDKDGNIKQEHYNPEAADELFELLDSAK